VAAALGPLACPSRLFPRVIFGPPRPPLSYQFCTWILIVRHVAAALGPLACPSRSARPRKCLNFTRDRSARPRKCLNL